MVGKDAAARQGNAVLRDPRALEDVAVLLSEVGWKIPRDLLGVEALLVVRVVDGPEEVDAFQLDAQAVLELAATLLFGLRDLGIDQLSLRGLARKRVACCVQARKSFSDAPYECSPAHLVHRVDELAVRLPAIGERLDRIGAATAHEPRTIEPSSASVQNGLWAISQACPSGSTNTPE
jgi:hypothetical protein